MSPNPGIPDTSSKPIRPTEHAIGCHGYSENQLLKEISEYVMTDDLDTCFCRVFDELNETINHGTRKRPGIFVSGLRGSGKSSFIKYLGLAVDRSVEIGGHHFADILKNKLTSDHTKESLQRALDSFDPAVFFLNLTQEIDNQAAVERISTIAYRKVLQWAGYSTDDTVSTIERLLEINGRLDAFKTRVKEELNGREWDDVHNEPLVAVEIASRLATEFYPGNFNDDAAMARLDARFGLSLDDRIREIRDLVRMKSGKRNVMFVIDDLAQYLKQKLEFKFDFSCFCERLLTDAESMNCVLVASECETPIDSNFEIWWIKDKFAFQIHLTSREPGLTSSNSSRPHGSKIEAAEVE